MKCYNCNNILVSDKDICPKCGTNIKVYRRIVHTSNYYYNFGLAQAKSRNMTGAIEALKIALQISKTNMNARNLLGLIYYEIGEVAMAVREWNASKSFQYMNNPADQYLADLNNNKQVLDEAQHNIRKFNQALNNAQIGACDLAIVQLKKVLSVNPRMIKAYQLLGLLYIHQGKKAYAKEVLEKGLKLDNGNVLLRKYLKELDESSHSVSPVVRTVKELPIVPNNLRDYGSYLGSAVCILLGVLISFGILWYTVLPAQQSKYEKQAVKDQEEIQAELQAANEQIGVKDQKISELEEKLVNLEDENSELSNQKDQNEEKITKTEAYELMEQATIYTVREEWLNLVKMYPELEKASKQMSDSKYKEAFVALKTLYNTKMDQLLVEEGDKKVNSGSYVSAIENYAKAIELNKENAAAIYGVAYAYEMSSEKDGKKIARDYYNMVLQNHGNTEWAPKAQERLRYLQ